jgi:chemotaxis protein methyltransferase CheR
MRGYMTNADMEEIVLLLNREHGFDFSNYSAASFKRRVLRVMSLSRIGTFYDLKYAIINDKKFVAHFVQEIPVNVTEMFRDPVFFKKLDEKVLPLLASYPTIKIWHAGCSTGEEVYSLAIMLHEMELLKRCRIYATDINPAAIEKAKKGIIDLRLLKEYTQNYIKAGGTADFSSYYTARYDNAIIRKDLREKVVFSQHNLVIDGAFNEFQLICCRNVLIYFNKVLQNHVLKLFYNSLAPLGYLALGIKESLLFTDVKDRFEAIDAHVKIFRRKD